MAKGLKILIEVVCMKPNCSPLERGLTCFLMWMILTSLWRKIGSRRPIHLQLESEEIKSKAIRCYEDKEKCFQTSTGWSQAAWRGINGVNYEEPTTVTELCWVGWGSGWQSTKFHWLEAEVQRWAVRATELTMRAPEQPFVGHTDRAAPVSLLTWRTFTRLFSLPTNEASQCEAWKQPLPWPLLAPGWRHQGPRTSGEFQFFYILKEHQPNPRFPARFALS